MNTPKTNVDRSQSDSRCEKDHFDPSDPFPHVFPVASDATEPNFTALSSPFASVNHSKLQEIAVTANSAISAHPFEVNQKKNRIDTSRPVDRQTEPSASDGAFRKRLIKRPFQEPCVWESERRSWRKAMAKLKSPQPFIAFPHDYPVTHYPKYIPDFLYPDYNHPTPNSNKPPVATYVHTFKKRACTDKEEHAAKRSNGLDSPCGLSLSSTSGEKMKPAEFGSGDFCPINGPSELDDSESFDHGTSSGYDGDSSESDVDLSDQDASPSVPLKSLKKVRFANT